MFFTSVYIYVYKVAVRIILIYSTRGASDSAEDIYNNNSHSQGLKIGFQDQLLLNAGKKYCSILQYFRPSLSYHLSLRSLFCLFLSGRFTQFYCRLGDQIKPGHMKSVLEARISHVCWL